MKLISLTAKNVYRQFNFDIKFYSNVSILYGINGSGKTTVLKLINYIITGKFPELLKIDFDNLVLKYIFEDKEYYLKIIKNFEKTTDFYEEPDYYEEEYEEIEEWEEDNIEEELIFETNHLKLSSVLKNGFTSTSIHNLKNLYELKKIRKEFSDIFNVIFLSIERKEVLDTSENFIERIAYDDEFLEYLEKKYGKNLEDFHSVGDLRKNYSRFNRLRRERSGGDPRYQPIPRGFMNTPLRGVRRIIQKAHVEYFRYCSKLDSTYQQSSYEKLANFDNYSDIIKKLSHSDLEYIKIAKDRIIKQIEFFADEFKLIFKYEEQDFQNLIDNFEPESKKAMNNQSLDNDYLLNFTQFIKLDESAELLEENNRLKSIQFKPFKLLIDKLIEFFKGTNKVAFLGSAGNLRFKIENGEIIGIQNLSSGEQQILIFFTYLIFKGRDIIEPIMLYDEPELSLHIDWQEKFIESVLEINSSIQIIIATHSPAIGTKFTDKYVEVKSVNET